MSTRIQSRRDTASNWSGINPVLAAGETGYEIGTGKFKIGDGISAWSVLPYHSDDAAHDAAYATVGTANRIDPNRIPLLTNIEKARTGVWKYLVTGTSISIGDRSAQRVLSEHLKALYGDTGNIRENFGVYGGSYTNTIFGWRKQRYGGMRYTRMRGDNTAQALQRLGYFDRYVLEYSVEADSAPVEILCDGVSQGFTAGPGPQKYRQQFIVNTTLGTHEITIKAPVGTGYAYLEADDRIDTSRTGIDWVDSGLGGSGIKHMTTLMSTDAGMVDGIPIVGTNGLDYHFKRDDVDAFIVEHIVNDGGSYDVFVANCNYAVEATRAVGKPIVFIIEPMTFYFNSTYQQQRAFLLSLATNRHVTVIDWHAAIWQGDAQADIDRMKALFYTSPDFTHPIKPAYDVLSKLLTRELGLPPFPYNDRVQYAQANMLKPAGLPGGGRNKTAVVNGVTRTFAAPEGTALFPGSLGGGGGTTFTKGYFYRDALTDNRAQGAKDQIAASATSTPFGKYVLRNAGDPLYVNYFTTAMTEMFTVTLKVSGTFSAISTVHRFTDLSGNLLPVDQPTNGRSEINYVGDPDVPAVISFGIVGITTNPGNLTFLGRLFDIAITKSTVPVLDSSVGDAYTYLRVLPENMKAPVTAGVGGALRRYVAPTGPAFTITGPTTPGADNPGVVVPYYKDTTVPNLPQAVTANNDIAATGTADAFGKYKDMNNTNFYPDFGNTAGKPRMVTVVASGTVQIRVDSSTNIRQIVNGMVITESEPGVRNIARITASSTGAPIVFAVEVVGTATPTGWVSISGRVYGVHITDSTVPVITA